jgi:hypothetical protein
LYNAVRLVWHTLNHINDPFDTVPSFSPFRTKDRKLTSVKHCERYGPAHSLHDFEFGRSSTKSCSTRVHCVLGGEQCGFGREVPQLARNLFFEIGDGRTTCGGDCDDTDLVEHESCSESGATEQAIRQSQQVGHTITRPTSHVRRLVSLRISCSLSSVPLSSCLPPSFTSYVHLLSAFNNSHLPETPHETVTSETTLYARNLPLETTEDVINETFGRFGPIKSIRMQKDKMSGMFNG